MNHIHIVAILAVLQFIFFGALVGLARGKYGVEAPAVHGHPLFERAYRVQMNTLEQLLALLPALYIAAVYWPAPWVAGAGWLYLLGRIIYWRSYMADPRTRALGFLLSALPILALLGAALLGAVLAVI